MKHTLYFVFIGLVQFLLNNGFVSEKGANELATFLLKDILGFQLQLGVKFIKKGKHNVSN
jgi:hypothetical protein